MRDDPEKVKRTISRKGYQLMDTVEKKMAKAYLLGAYLGDGHARWIDNDGSPNYTFLMPSTDRDLLDKVSQCIYRIFPYLKNRIIIDNRDTYEMLRCHSKDLAHFLRSHTDVKKRLPRCSDPMLFREFVAGLMDTDGWITEHNAVRPKWSGKVWQMGFATTLPWYRLFNKLLQQAGVILGKSTVVWKPKDVEWADCYRTYFNIASFVNAGFYFSIERKQQRLRNWQHKMFGESSETRSQSPRKEEAI